MLLIWLHIIVVSAFLCHQFVFLLAQEYCSGSYNMDCGDEPRVVDALELSVDCPNSSLVHLKWQYKLNEKLQLVWVEYVCFDSMSDNYTFYHIVEGAYTPNGNYTLELVPPHYQSCVLSGCVFIYDMNCPQLNKMNATCLLQEETNQPEESSGSHSDTAIHSTYITSSISTIISLYSTNTQLSIATTSSSVFASTTPLIMPSPSSGTKKQSPHSNNDYVVYPLVATLCIFGVVTAPVIIFIVVYCYRRSKREAWKSTSFTDEQNDTTLGSSACSFTNSPLKAESIVTDIASLAATHHTPEHLYLSDMQSPTRPTTTSGVTSETPWDSLGNGCTATERKRSAIEIPRIPAVQSPQFGEHLFIVSPSPSDTSSSYCRIASGSDTTSLFKTTDYSCSSTGTSYYSTDLSYRPESDTLSTDSDEHLERRGLNLLRYDEGVTAATQPIPIDSNKSMEFVRNQSPLHLIKISDVNDNRYHFDDELAKGNEGFKIDICDTY